MSPILAEYTSAYRAPPQSRSFTHTKRPAGARCGGLSVTCFAFLLGSAGLVETIPRCLADICVCNVFFLPTPLHHHPIPRALSDGIKWPDITNFLVCSKRLVFSSFITLCDAFHAIWGKGEKKEKKKLLL